MDKRPLSVGAAAMLLAVTSAHSRVPRARVFFEPDNGSNPSGAPAQGEAGEGAPAGDAPPAQPPAPVAVPVAAPAAAAAPKPNIFQRAQAVIADKGGLIAQLAEKDQTIAKLQQDLATANGTIATQNAELTDLRAGRDQLEQALNGATAQRRDVAETVAALGFPAAQLPATQPDERKIGATSMDSLHEQYAAEKDPRKKSEIFGQIQTLRMQRN